MSKGSVQLLSWNIAGWRHRANDENFLKFLSSYDLMALQETWMTTADEMVQLPGFISWLIPAERFKSKG